MRTKTDERRQRILGIAIDAFQELGYEKCSMSEVAARVGGSKATLYNYFASKEELFVAVMRTTAAQLRDVFDSLRPGDDFDQVLLVFARSYAAAILAEALVSTMRMVQHEGGRSSLGSMFYAAGPKMGTDRLAGFLGDAMSRGQLRQADPAVAARHLQVLLESEYLQRRLLGAVPAPAVEQSDAAADRALAVFRAAYVVSDG